MLPRFWVASTKPEAALGRRQGRKPWQGRGWALAPRDRGPEVMDGIAWSGTKLRCRDGAPGGKGRRPAPGHPRATRATERLRRGADRRARRGVLRRRRRTGGAPRGRGTELLCRR